MYVGSGELEEEVKQYAKQSDLLDKIIITGWVNDVEKYIPAFDIAVLPSKWEGFGLAIVEYMVCNKPIIASNVGGITDIIISEKNGLLFEVGDYEELSKKINFSALMSRHICGKALLSVFFSPECTARAHLPPARDRRRPPSAAPSCR